MRVLHAIQGLPVAAGTTAFVVGMANELARMGHTVTVAVYCEPTRDDISLFDTNVMVASIPSIMALHGGAGMDFDIVHIHSMWNIWLHRVAAWCRRSGVPYVCSPHGSATEWALCYRRWRKRLAWLVYQKEDFSHAVAFHATGSDEVSDIRRLGLGQEVVVAPLGVTLPPMHHVRLNAGHKGGRFVFLFVSRVQKKKGLENLIKAVSILKTGNLLSADVGEVIFRIVGPDQENHTAELKLLAMRLGVVKYFEFVGALYGDALSAEYENADVFVLPSLSENFAVVVIDALAHGLPVLTTRGTPWRELEERRCGWWVDVGGESLAAALAIVLKMTPESLVDMGAAGRRLVEERYSWPVVARLLADGYSHVLRNATVSSR